MDILKEIILDCIEAFLFLLVFEALYNKKRFIVQNKIKTGLFCALYISLNLMTQVYIPNIYHTLFLSFFCILSLTLITQIRIFSSVITFFLFLTIIFITENFTQTIEMFLFNINLNQIFLTPRYLWIFLITCKSLQILIVVIIFKFNSYFTKFNLFEKEGTLFLNLIIQIGIFGLFILSVNFSVFDINNVKTYNTIIFIIYFVFLLISFKDLREREKIININNNYKVQEYQIKTMEEIINIIRKEKHDFANHINVIRGLCLLNKPNTVERINDYVTKISETLHSSFKYLDTGNDYLDGLLSIKNNYAIKNNINFEVIIDEPFSSIKIREDELISIVSNLVDNAFESFHSKPDTENKEIFITTFKEDKKFCIEVTDNGDVIPESIKRKIFDKGFSTKTKESNDHGFGLYITRQLVERNNGTISVESIPERTEFLVEFRLEE
ncbi:GHKL domain-containing protein [Clostridium sp. PL3]|uniref:GHKL domain-containing protein n=1 Tax=Clostridium thailandense TaxID=2794346 RepID=A0A949TKB4_9CLOT|nr:ATP-binding protein [Clostridium thailandense]MBV7273885.1 GHKL domain-containing protein [Clostridium thailandense]